MRVKVTRTRSILITLAGALAFAGLVPAIPAAAAPATEAVTDRVAAPQLRWQPCGPDAPGRDCAVVSVPLDYDEPGGAKVHLALARVPAADPAHRIGTLFVNPGGPGGSGVRLVLGGFGGLLSANLDGRFDIVGFDPRGVAASDPLHCFASADDRDAFFQGVPNFPYLRSQERPFFDKLRSLAGECLSRDRTIARHMSTADVARDMDLLRRAVGDAKLSYLGFSYGSYIGNTYASLFPSRIRAMVIDGVLDPQLWSSGWQIAIDRVAIGREFDEFLHQCDLAGAACAFAAPGGSKARWEALADAIRAHPLDLGDGTFYTYDQLIGDASGSLYDPEVWGGPDGYGAFFDLVADAALGDQSAAARARSLRVALDPALNSVQSAREADYPNGFDAYNGNVCADTEFPSALRDYRAISEYAEAGSRLGPYWWWSNAACADWPTAPDRFAGPWSTRTSAPVLVVGNYFDGVTGFEGAVASARFLQGSRLLAYAGWGHTAYGRSACATEHTDRYLLRGTLPARGTVCPANPNPFLPTGAARTADTHRPLIGLPTGLPVRR